MRTRLNVQALMISLLSLPLIGGTGAAGTQAAAAREPATTLPQATDLNPEAWPAAGDGERRWWIPVPSEPSISSDADLSADPRQWRLELMVGRIMPVDCNRHQFGGRIRTETLQPRGVTIHRVELGAMLSTRMACPDQTLRRRFVTLAGRPYVVPYDASRPLVVYAPQDVEVRWRIWRPERRLQPARPF
ncbi:MAG: ecotin family protein [Cyanobacteriota bacterium]